MVDYSKYDYNERAQNEKRYNYWGQVRRTINGHPVKNDQIQLIFKTKKKNLELTKKDYLLDLGCGNGALTNLFKNDVTQILGIDRSEYLISIANSDFSNQRVSFIEGNLQEIIKEKSFKDIYNKVLLYGVFSFLNDDQAKNLFSTLSNSKSMEKLLLGNIRNIDSHHEFYGKNMPNKVLNNNKTSMGRWFNKKYFYKVACKYGWRIKIKTMPDNFYAKKYYFDVIFSKI